MALAPLIHGVPGVAVYYIKGICVSGKMIEKHLHHFELLLQGLNDTGFQLKKQKCFIVTKSVKHLCHRIDQDDLHPTDKKV